MPRRKKFTKAQVARMKREEEALKERRKHMTMDAFELVMFRSIRESAQHHLRLIESDNHYNLDTDMLECMDHTPESWKAHLLEGMHETIEHATFREGEILSMLGDQMEYFSMCGFPMDEVFGRPAPGAGNR